MEESMNRLKKMMIVLLTAVMLAGCGTKYDYSFLKTGSGSMSTITCSGGILEEPFNMGGNSINEFCAAMNLIKEVVVVPENEIPEDTGYELAVYTRTGHTTMNIARPYIAVGGNWYRLDNDEDLYYLDMMIAVIERQNTYVMPEGTSN